MNKNLQKSFAFDDMGHKFGSKLPESKNRQKKIW